MNGAGTQHNDNAGVVSVQDLLYLQSTLRNKFEQLLRDRYAGLEFRGGYQNALVFNVDVVYWGIRQAVHLPAGLSNSEGAGVYPFSRVLGWSRTIKVARRKKTCVETILETQHFLA